VLFTVVVCAEFLKYDLSEPREKEHRPELLTMGLGTWIGASTCTNASRL
jgi:hypothetical protein